MPKTWVPPGPNPAKGFQILNLWSLPLLCLFLTLAAAPTHAQETLSQVQRELDRVEKETQREKDAHAAERKRAQEFETQKVTKLKALREQIQIQDARIDSLKGQAASAKRRRAALKKQEAFYRDKHRAFQKALTQVIAAWSDSLKSDFPHKLEKRLSDFRELAATSSEGALPVEETLARWFTLLQTGLEMGYDTEIVPGTFRDPNGASFEGTYVRLGTVALAFAADDGKQMAYLGRNDSGYVWRSGELESAVKENILLAFQVAQGKVSPQLVPLPLEARWVREEGR
jgi:hypothetical protein